MYHSSKSRDFPDFSLFPKSLSLKSFGNSWGNSYTPYLLLIIVFHLVKHQKVPQYYFHDCLKNFILLFMSLLTAPVVKNSYIYAIIYLIFIKNVLKNSSSAKKFFKSLPVLNFNLRKKMEIAVRKILAPFYNLVALMLGWNCVKGLRVTWIVKKNKFEGVWGRLAVRNCFQRQSFKKHLRQILVFMWNRAIRQTFNFHFSVNFG